MEFAIWKLHPGGTPMLAEFEAETRAVLRL